jgi:hypothetical protein
MRGNPGDTNSTTKEPHNSDSYSMPRTLHSVLVASGKTMLRGGTTAGIAVLVLNSTTQSKWLCQGRGGHLLRRPFDKIWLELVISGKGSLHS